MTEQNKSTPTMDDRLADFTDRALDGKTTVLASGTDRELRELENTVMRINRAFPKEALDEKTLKRMQADFKSRARKASAPSRPIWQSQQSRQRFVLAFAMIAILAAIFVSLPFLNTGNGEIQGTAGINAGGTLLLVAIGCVIAILIWLRLRK